MKARIAEAVDRLREETPAFIARRCGKCGVLRAAAGETMRLTRAVGMKELYHASAALFRQGCQQDGME